MSTNVSITEEAALIAKSYGKNVSQGIVEMERKLKETPERRVDEMIKSELLDKETMTLLVGGIIKTEIDKAMMKVNGSLMKYELGVENTHKNFMEFISSGQGAVRVYDKPETYIEKPIPVVPKFKSGLDIKLGRE
jgi:hypothetical protein